MNSNPDSRERELERLKESLAPSSECATLDELAALADASLAAPSRAQVAVHVASCERCEVELLLLKEFESASPRPEEEETVEWIVARLRRRFREARVAAVKGLPDPHEEEEGSWRRLLQMRPVSAIGFALAAAMLLLAVNVELREEREPSLPRQIEQGAPVFRSDAMELRGPAGDLDRPPAELRWEPVAAAATYSVEVMEVDRSPVWEAKVPQSAVALPETVRARLVPGKPLLWQVVAKDAAGKTIATSPIQRFRVTTRQARTEPLQAPAAPATPSAPVDATRILQHGRQLSTELAALAAPCGSAAALSPSLDPIALSLKVLNRSAPAAGTAQMTVTLTEPKPIATGCGSLVTTAPFDAVLGAALFSGAGVPSEVAGAAVVDGTSVAIHAVSPSGEFGTAPDGTIAVVTFHVSPAAVPGRAGRMTMDPASLWLDPAGGLYPQQIKPGNFEVSGSVSIDNVIPGSGFLPAGSTVTVMGTGFVPGTFLEIDDVPVVATFVGPDRIDAVTGVGAEFHGRRLRARNPDHSRASYYSYMRAARVGESARPLLARTMPIFPSTVSSTAFVPIIAGAGVFFGLAVQNPDAGPAAVTVDLRSIDGAIASATLSLPPRSKISREVSELFAGISAPAGSFLAVTSDRPVQVLGLVGNDALGSVLPVMPSLALP
jgi:hypothetical protein